MQYDQLQISAVDEISTKELSTLYFSKENFRLKYTFRSFSIKYRGIFHPQNRVTTPLHLTTNSLILRSVAYDFLRTTNLHKKVKYLICVN